MKISPAAIRFALLTAIVIVIAPVIALAAGGFVCARFVCHHVLEGAVIVLAYAIVCFIAFKTLVRRRVDRN